MTIFNGRYRWDGTKTNNQDPIAWSPGAYDVKIFRCSSSSLKVERLKCIVCVYASTGEGHSISANPEKFAKQICKDFSLDMERVLWVEDNHKDEDRYEVIMFTRSGKIGNTVFYRSQKRIAFKSEIEMIEKELSGAESSVE
jgi:hypothetical protein